MSEAASTLGRQLLRTSHHEDQDLQNPSSRGQDSSIPCNPPGVVHGHATLQLFLVVLNFVVTVQIINWLPGILGLVIIAFPLNEVFSLLLLCNEHGLDKQ